MRRILFLIRSLGVAGAETQAVISACELSRRGHEVAVAWFYGANGFSTQTKEAGVIEFKLSVGNGLVLARQVRRYRKLLSDFSPDIVLGYMPLANTVMGLAAFGKYREQPHRVFGVRTSTVDWGKYTFMTRVSYGLEALCSSKADLVVCNSHAAVSALRERGWKHHSECVIHNGIDTQKFHPASDLEAAELREKFEVSSEQFLIATPARFDPVKDHLSLFKAVNKLRRNYPNVRLICCGAGAGQEQARQQVHRLGVDDIVTILNHVHPITELLQAADVICMPSAFGEGFNNVLGEAMACAKPCVATRAGDAEMIVGDTGFMADLKSVESLVESLGRALDLHSRSELLSLGQRARERVETNYSISRLGDELDGVISSVVDGEQRK